MTNSQPAELPGLTKSGVKYAFAPVPGKRGLAKTTLGVNDWIWAFKTKADHRLQDEAFLDFVLSDKWQKDFFNQYKLLPITHGASKQVAKSNPNLKPFLDSLPTDTFYPVNKKAWAQVNAKIKQIIGTAVSNSKRLRNRTANSQTVSAVTRVAPRRLGRRGATRMARAVRREASLSAK